MKRREFLKNASIAGAMPFVLNGIPFNLMAGNTDLQKMAAACPNDRVLVILQLHGGNDGLNARHCQARADYGKANAWTDKAGKQDWRGEGVIHHRASQFINSVRASR